MQWLWGKECCIVMCSVECNLGWQGRGRNWVMRLLAVRIIRGYSGAVGRGRGGRGADGRNTSRKLQFGSTVCSCVTKSIKLLALASRR